MLTTFVLKIHSSTVDCSLSMVLMPQELSDSNILFNLGFRISQSIMITFLSSIPSMAAIFRAVNVLPSPGMVATLVEMTFGPGVLSINWKLARKAR